MSKKKVVFSFGPPPVTNQMATPFPEPAAGDLLHAYRQTSADVQQRMRRLAETNPRDRLRVELQAIADSPWPGTETSQRIIRSLEHEITLLGQTGYYDFEYTRKIAILEAWQRKHDLAHPPSEARGALTPLQQATQFVESRQLFGVTDRPDRHDRERRLLISPSEEMAAQSGTESQLQDRLHLLISERNSLRQMPRTASTDWELDRLHALIGLVDERLRQIESQSQPYRPPVQTAQSTGFVSESHRASNQALNQAGSTLHHTQAPPPTPQQPTPPLRSLNPLPRAIIRD